jgi:hypothetical protein
MLGLLKVAILRDRTTTVRLFAGGTSLVRLDRLMPSGMKTAGFCIVSPAKPMPPKLIRKADEWGYSYIIETQTISYGAERVRICSRASGHLGKYAIIWAGNYPVQIDRDRAAKILKQTRKEIKYDQR